MDPRYEVKAVGLLAAGFGMVGLDRFIINPLFPVMQKELSLTYQDMGWISAALALGWGVASVFCGRLSDRVGRKRVLVTAIAAFSLLVASTGLASGVASLLLIRALMGLAEGAYVPASIVATIEASKPTRLGLNTGLQQMAAPLMGTFLGPLIAVGLLKVLPSWHWVFAVVAVPGFLIAVLLARMLHDRTPGPVTRLEASSPVSWREVLTQRAVWVNALSMCCFLTCLIVLAAFMPNYLTDHLKVGLDAMSLILTGLGAGSCLGMVLVPAVSDRLGRKRVMLVALGIALLALCLLPSLGAEPTKLFIVLFVAAFMTTGALAITVGPLTHDSVPKRFVTTATGVVVGIGEILGGAMSPALAGELAQRLGITVVPWIAIAATGVALLLVLFVVREPRSTMHPAAVAVRGSY